MKPKKYMIVFIFTIFFCFMSFNLTVADEIPSTINIGLYFGDTALKSLKLNSEGGFLVGYNDSENLNLITKIFDDNISVNSVNLKDFTLIKDGFKNQSDAESFVRNLESKENIYIIYSDDWKVIKVNNIDMNGSNYITIKGSSYAPVIALPITTEDTISFISMKQNVIELGGRRYRGNIKLKPSGNGKMTVINELEIDEYLYGVVPKEMPASWPIEALKAQAVAARTYAVSNISKWGKYGFDLTCSTKDQVYGGYDAENPKSNRAVDETRGKIAVYNGQPIIALYHSDSGGITEDNSEVFGSDIPYLRSVKERYETSSPNKTWEIRYSINEINQKLQEVTRKIGEIKDISVIEKSNSGRVKELLISGTEGKEILTGRAIRDILGLKSTLFEIYKDNTDHNSQNDKLFVRSSYKTDMLDLNGKYIINSKGVYQNTKETNVVVGALKRRYDNNTKPIANIITFRGKGWGHGVGMSQWGAKAMAENGHDYVDILQHYYKGIEIK